ncbi:two-component sensor histidine kinase, partial [Burkholderia sp. SIMBA_057]
AARRIDLDALLDSIVCDYTDAGQDVALHGGGPLALVTRPKALRRIVGNLVDNALKFAGAAEIDVQAAPDGGAVIAVRDRG